MADGFNWIAAYAAVVSTMTAAWTIRQGLKDRAKLKVEVSLARFADDPARPRELLLTVTNVGRRPITVMTWGGAYAEPVDGFEEVSFRPKNMPCELKEFQQVSEFADPQLLLDRSVKRLWVTDTSGRRWFISKRHLRSLSTRSTVVATQA